MIERADDAEDRRGTSSTIPDGWGAVPSVAALRAATDRYPTVDGATSPLTNAVPMSPDGRPVGRPAPQYGEYAPEGWVSPFLVDEAPSLPQASADRWQLDSAGGARPRPRGWTASDATSGSASGLPSPDGRGSHGAVGRRSSRADVLLTAVLLGIGLTSVIQQLADVSAAAASVAQTLAAQYVALAHPEALVVAAAWCGVGQAAVYVVALWWSIRRIRARRRAMWIPLAGGALVTIASGIVYFAVALHDPAFAAWFASHSPS